MTEGTELEAKPERLPGASLRPAHAGEGAYLDTEGATATKLSGAAFDALTAALDQPMPEETRKLLEEKPVWA